MTTTNLIRANSMLLNILKQRPISLSHANSLNLRINTMRRRQRRQRLNLARGQINTPSSRRPKHRPHHLNSNLNSNQRRPMQRNHRLKITRPQGQRIRMLPNNRPFIRNIRLINQRTSLNNNLLRRHNIMRTRPNTFASRPTSLTTTATRLAISRSQPIRHTPLSIHQPPQYNL